VGKFEVRFDEWMQCVVEGACNTVQDQNWGRGPRPVINTSWTDAKAYTAWLAKKTGKAYRLLTEAEWEYAARAGTTTPFTTGVNINPTQANYDTSVSFAGSVTAPSKQQTVPVGSYAPNKFGLYDVHGNVWEWVEDCWQDSHKDASPDGRARVTKDCTSRVIRGGSWDVEPRSVRSAIRSSP
jgi:formylglycine-generating enzyme required for sulfatase activity